MLDHRDYPTGGGLVVGGCRAWLAPEFSGLEIVDDVEIASFWVDFFQIPLV